VIGVKVKNNHITKMKRNSLKHNKKSRKGRPKQHYNLQTVRMEFLNVQEFTWAGSIAPSVFTFGPTHVPANVLSVMEQFRYYKVEGFGFYLNPVEVFEHTDFAVAAIPFQVGGPYPNFGQLLTKNGSFLFSAESHQPSIGQSNLGLWRKYCHRVPHAVLCDQAEKMFSCDGASTDTEADQFQVVIIPDVSTTNKLKMHWYAKIVFHTPTESGVQLRRAIDNDRKLLAKLPLDELVSVLKEASPQQNTAIKGREDVISLQTRV